MRARVDQLGVTQASIRLAGADEIEVVLPESDAASTQDAVSETGQLYIYDWEPNVIGPGGEPAPREGMVTGDSTSEGAGGLAAGLLEYRAVLLAAKRPAILRESDTTWSHGCTPRQAAGCLYGSWYLLDAAHEEVLRGPEDTQQALYANGYKPPKGARPKVVRVNPGTVLVQARALEDEVREVLIASPNSWYVLNDNPVLSSANILNPAQSIDEVTNQPVVTFGFTSYGKTIFERLTEEMAHRGREAQRPEVGEEEALQHFAVVLDGRLMTVPSVDYTKYPQGIKASGGSEVASGFASTSAQDIAVELQPGSLPVKLELISRSRVPGTTKVAGISRSFGAFVGYAWFGRVKSLQASWTVPRILHGSPSGVAGTWIGATAPGTSEPFIQVGVNEQRLTPSTVSRPENRYYAFWSDHIHHFHPQFLFQVNAGDELSASLTLAHKRWTLAIVDTDIGASAHFSTSDEAHGSFNEAQWTQEDVTDEGTGKPYPYPRLSKVLFRHLLVNSIIPSHVDLTTRWMSADAGNLAPSPLRDDSFTLRQAILTAAAEQYLGIAEPENTAATTFENQLSRWTTKTPRSQIASASARFSAALRNNIQAFSSKPWPTRIRHLIDALIHSTRVTLNQLKSSALLSPAGLAAWRSMWMSENPMGEAAAEIRRALPLPGIAPET